MNKIFSWESKVKHLGEMKNLGNEDYAHSLTVVYKSKGPSERLYKR